MDNTLPSDWLQQMSYLPRVSIRDGRAIEEALAGATLFDTGARIDGAVIEAAYAYDQPPLLKRLADDRVRRLIDPQTLRFVGENFVEINRLSRLPYAPDRPIRASSFSAEDAKELAAGALVFQQDRGVDAYIAPTLPLADHDLHLWSRHCASLLEAACAANGSVDIERKPLLAEVAPGSLVQQDPRSVVDLLMDHPVDGIYVQPLRLNPVKDSLEKLARFVQFMEALRSTRLPIVVGRVGAFGLVLQSLGATAFDSGLGMAESHDLAQLNRPLTEKERAARAAGNGGGAERRIYLSQVKTTLPASATNLILQNGGLRHNFTCSLGCCRFRAIEELGSRSRSHYLYTRSSEVEALSRIPVQALRIGHMETQLQQAVDLSDRIQKAMPEGAIPDFGHLRRWLGLLAREQEGALAA
jgi:hypothetical protein